VEVTFDPEVTGFHDLLEVFWSNRNPTTMIRQGPDAPTGSRSEDVAGCGASAISQAHLQRGHARHNLLAR